MIIRCLVVHQMSKRAAYLKPQFGALGAKMYFSLGVVTTWQNRCLEWSPIKPNLPFYEEKTTT